MPFVPSPTNDDEIVFDRVLHQPLVEDDPVPSRFNTEVELTSSAIESARLPNRFERMVSRESEPLIEALKEGYVLTFKKGEGLPGLSVRVQKGKVVSPYGGRFPSVTVALQIIATRFEEGLAEYSPPDEVGSQPLDEAIFGGCVGELSWSNGTFTFRLTRSLGLHSVLSLGSVVRYSRVGTRLRDHADLHKALLVLEEEERFENTLLLLDRLLSKDDRRAYLAVAEGVGVCWSGGGQSNHRGGCNLLDHR